MWRILYKRAGWSFSAVALCACALGNNEPPITLVEAAPDPVQCQYVAQAVGSGEGDFIPNAPGKLQLREDAVEEIKKIARLRHANVVQVVELRQILTTLNGYDMQSIIGQLYQCQ